MHYLNCQTLPKIRVGWVGLIWETMARQTRAKKWQHICSIIRAVQNYTYTKRSSRAFEVSSCWDQRGRALHWRYSSRCIRFLGPIHSVFCTLYKHTKKKHAYISVAQKHLGYPAIRHEDPSTFPLEPQNDWTPSCAHPFLQPGHICILRTTFVLLTPTQALRTFSHS